MHNLESLMDLPLTYAHVCARMLTCVHRAVGRMLTYADVCLGMQVYIEQSDVRIKRMARKVPPPTIHLILPLSRLSLCLSPSLSLYIYICMNIYILHLYI
jgi:hypothetical protein